MIFICELLQSALTVAVTQHTDSLFLMRHTTHSDLVNDYYYYYLIFFWRLLMVQTQLYRRRRRELHSLWPIAAMRYFNRNKRRHNNVPTATTITILTRSHIMYNYVYCRTYYTSLIRRLMGRWWCIMGTPLSY